MGTNTYKHVEPHLSENALSVIERRYLVKDKEGKVVETSADMFRRVAEGIAHADKKFNDKEPIPQPWQNSFIKSWPGLNSCRIPPR